MKDEPVISKLPATEAQSDINVTPLIDVCLVLLIIFMVVTPLLQKGVDVQLPETPDPLKIPETTRQINMAIRQDGTVYIGQNVVADKQLKDALVAIYQQNPEKQVVIKADARLKYRSVRKVMQITNEAGFTGVGLVTNKKGSGL